MDLDNHEMEKASLAIRLVGRILWNLHQGCLESGFNQEQSFAITLEYVNGFATRSGPQTGPESDEH